MDSGHRTWAHDSHFLWQRKHESSSPHMLHTYTHASTQRRVHNCRTSFHRMPRIRINNFSFLFGFFIWCLFIPCKWWNAFRTHVHKSFGLLNQLHEPARCWITSHAIYLSQMNRFACNLFVIFFCSLPLTGCFLPLRWFATDHQVNKYEQICWICNASYCHFFIDVYISRNLFNTLTRTLCMPSRTCFRLIQPKPMISPRMWQGKCQ